MAELTAQTMELLADTETPVSAYLKLCAGQSGSFLMESGEWSETAGRYSVVAWRPLAGLRLGSAGVELTVGGQKAIHPAAEFFPLLRRIRAELKVDLPAGLPFAGALVGYVGWEAALLLERLPGAMTDEPPTAQLAYPSRLVIFDHLRRALVLVAIDQSAQACQDGLAETRQRLLGPLPAPPGPASLELRDPPPERYAAMVGRAKEYILDGDIFQVVPSDRFEGESDMDPLSVYRWLRVKSPSPYMFYLNFGDLRLVGSSPETMIKVNGGRLKLKPIAGTRGRSADPAKDKALEDEMLASEKERAEHLMLVDLGRNDAGRVCRYGSVGVDPFMIVERYSHVMHMVSEVGGDLLPELDEVDAFMAAFPAGTVSGAPKVRAMEIIHELEQSPRGPYGGAVGFFGPGRNLDTCLAIRIIQFLGQKITVQVGAGIVADSVPAYEYKELQHKAAQSLAALRLAAQGGV